jgi:uncharacterized protein (TIGR03435 family)
MNIRGLPGKLALVSIGGCLLLAIFSPSFVRAQSSATEDWEKAAGGKMTFDVASVKPDTADLSTVGVRTNVPLSYIDNFSSTGGLFSASNYPLLVYIDFAYKQDHQDNKFITAQLPKWAVMNRYDIEARALGNPGKDQYRLMVQSLLRERFGLVTHYEEREVPALMLVLDKPGKLGPQLRQRKPGDSACTPTGPVGDTAWPGIVGEVPTMCSVMEGMRSSKPGRVRDGSLATPASMLADMFSYLYTTDRTIVNGTGLGTVDWVIEFVPDGPSNAEAPLDSNGPTFLDALKDQLGLKFEPVLIPYQFLKIDHIEEPSPN